MYTIWFQAANRDYWCRRPGHLQTIPVAIWKNFTQPAGQKCHTYGSIDFGELNTTNFQDYFSRFNYSASPLQSCSSFEYDNSMIGHTIISEWSIICGKEHLVSIVEMCFLAGAALGAVSSGWISDQFGRRHTLMYFAVAQTSIGE
jgi:MFS transporter, OCT family, solute carrier family 22 (organic cation transporter), member 4/5